jgi:hypothetical protein
MYDGTQKTIINCAILLLLAAKDVDSGRQSATSHTPKNSAGIEKMACRLFITNRRGVLENNSVEVLKGPISSTAIKPTAHAQITINIVISCAK